MINKLNYALISGILIATTTFIIVNVNQNEKLLKQSKNTVRTMQIKELKMAKMKITSRNSLELRKRVESKVDKVIQIEKAGKVEKLEQIYKTEQKDKAMQVDKSNAKKEIKEQNKKSTTKSKYIKIKDVHISKTMDLTVRTGLSKKDFIKLISGVKYDTSGFFEDNAGKIYDLCEKYKINEIFFCGLISAESSWNIASNHRKTHNYISLMRRGKLIKYNSVDEGLTVAAQKLHYNYLTPSGKFYYGKTLRGVKTKFCPSPSWVNLVYGRMKQIV